MKTIIAFLAATLLLLGGCVVNSQCPDQDYYYVDNVPTPFGLIPMTRMMRKGFVTDGINRSEEAGGWLTQEEWDAISEPEATEETEPDDDSDIIELRFKSIMEWLE